MALFSSKPKELNKEQADKLNSLLPESFRKDTWEVAKIKNYDGESLWDAVRLALKKLDKSINTINKECSDIISDFLKKASTKISIYNTELYDAKPLGLVHIGSVKRFNTASTGNRFENGAIGYAIEQASDEVWAKNNAQENAVEQVLQELKMKALSQFPDCDSIFKYDVEFRELGSSGNVFIYMRGTACKSNLGNTEINELIEHKETALKEKQIILDEKKSKYEKYDKNLDKIPCKSNEIEKMLGSY